MKGVVVKSQIESIVGWVVEIPSAAVIDLRNHMAHAMWIIHEVDVTPIHALAGCERKEGACECSTGSDPMLDCCVGAAIPLNANSELIDLVHESQNHFMIRGCPD